MGVVIRRPIDFLIILLIPTPLVHVVALFCSCIRFLYKVIPSLISGIHTGGRKTWDIPPPPQNPFSIDIWHNYNKIRLFYKDMCWQGYAYALKCDPELISEH